MLDFILFLMSTADLEINCYFLVVVTSIVYYFLASFSVLPKLEIQLYESRLVPQVLVFFDNCS